MANNISWCNIYDTTWWGIGVSTNTISWGKSYEDLANGINLVTKRFSERVEADGGTVESLECVNAIFTVDYNWDYSFRVVDDGGVVVSLECVTII